MGAASSRLSCDKRCKGIEFEWLGNKGWDFRAMPAAAWFDDCPSTGHSSKFDSLDGQML